MSCGSLRSSTLLMDDYGGSYRYHTLLRDFLQRELAVREPDQVTTLHRRAAAWYQANHAIERAVDHAFAAGDPDLVATLVGNGFVQLSLVRPASDDPSLGQASGRGRSRGTPMARRAGGLGGDRGGRCRRDRSVSRMSPSEERSRAGRPTAPRPSRPDGRCSEPAWLAGGRTTRWRTPPERSSSKGTMAPGETSRSGSWPSRASRSAIWPAQTRPWPTRSSRPDRRATSRSCTACSGTALSWPPSRAPGTPPLPSIAESDTIDPAPQIDGYLSTVPSRAVRIRLMIHRGDIAGARRELARATGLRPLLTAAAPAGAVQLLLAFARAHVAVDDPAGARALVAQAGDVIRDRPDLGVLPAEVDALRATLAARAPGPRRGRHEPHGRRAPRAVVPALLPLVQGDRAATRRQGDDDQVTSARDLPEARRGDPQRRRRPGRRGGLLERFLPVARARAIEWRPRRRPTT